MSPPHTLRFLRFLDIFTTLDVCSSFSILRNVDESGLYFIDNKMIGKEQSMIFITDYSHCFASFFFLFRGLQGTVKTWLA